MREIEFRGKRLDNGEWVYGGIVHQTDYYGVKCEKWFIIDGTDTQDYDIGSEYQVASSTIGQYTGLIDITGKRIFEGDVIRFRELIYGLDCWVGVVEYDYGSMYVVRGGKNEECETGFEIQLSRIAKDRIEVIGNVHDNQDGAFGGMTMCQFCESYKRQISTMKERNFLGRHNDIELLFDNKKFHFNFCPECGKKLELEG